MQKNNLADKTQSQQHPFHLVTPSPWPIFISLWLPLLLLQTVNYIHGHHGGACPFIQVIEATSILLFILIVIAWFNDVVIEATYEGNHTFAVQRGLRYGIVLFIVSEIMFFFGFFWAFFHSSLNPSIFIGNIWPPKGILPLETWNIPFLNTIISLSSGVAVTWSHLELLGSNKSLYIHFSARYTSYVKIEAGKTDEDGPTLYAAPHHDLLYRIVNKNKPPENLTITLSTIDHQEDEWRKETFKHSILGLILTLFYGTLFTLLQRYEYIHAKFDISDSVYGSTFFIITGLHGLHVLIGTLFLGVQLARIVNYHLTPTHHVGYEAAIWYWHFVDVVWLIVFISLYFWNSYIA